MNCFDKMKKISGKFLGMVGMLVPFTNKTTKGTESGSSSSVTTTTTMTQVSSQAKLNDSSRAHLRSSDDLEKYTLTDAAI